MEDEELARLRQQRLAQLQAQGQGSGPAGRPQAGGDKQQQQQQQQQAKEREEEMRNSMLSAVLTQEARARLATLAAAKPDRARMVEDIIIQNTRMGGIRGKVDENSLKDLLERVTQTKRETKVSYERRRVFDDDSDDLDDD